MPKQSRKPSLWIASLRSFTLHHGKNVIFFEEQSGEKTLCCCNIEVLLQDEKYNIFLRKKSGSELCFVQEFYL